MHVTKGFMRMLRKSVPDRRSPIRSWERTRSPKHMNSFVHTFEDNGGVHINSGIPNHAFYQVATQLGGNAWERAGRIWYDSLRDPRVRPNTGFRRYARITYDVAGRLYGVESAERQAVHGGWAAVGIEL